MERGRENGGMEGGREVGMKEWREGGIRYISGIRYSYFTWGTVSQWYCKWHQKRKAKKVHVHKQTQKVNTHKNGDVKIIQGGREGGGREGEMDRGEEGEREE